MTLRILESANEDLWKGYGFYEGQKPGIGDYFIDTLTGEIESLLLFAGTHPIRLGYHRMLSGTFPSPFITELKTTKLSYVRSSIADRIQPPLQNV